MCMKVRETSPERREIDQSTQPGPGGLLIEMQLSVTCEIRDDSAPLASARHWRTVEREASDHAGLRCGAAVRPCHSLLSCLRD